MTVALQRPTGFGANTARARDRVVQREVERRLQGVMAQIEATRRGLHQAQEAVRTAEDALLLRRQECEHAAVHIAELAELAESLQRSLYQSS